MLHLAVKPFSLLFRHPWWSLLVALSLGAAALGGVHLWAWHHFRAAETALRTDEMEQAREHIAQCLRVWSRGAATQFLAARIERVSGHYPEADQHLMECVRLQHGPTEATQLEEVMLRAQAGDLKEVEAGLWKCVETEHPESARILETLARIYMRDARMGSALACLSKWLELEPGTARAWHWRGWVYERLQQPDKALPDYEKALELEPQRWGVRLRLARLLLERKNPGEAHAQLDELLRTHPDEPDVQVALAQCRQLEGEEEKAIQILDRLLEKHPNTFEALALRGQLVAQQQQPAEAETWLRKALAQKPADLRTLYTLYQCLEQQGKDKEAAETLNRHKAIEVDNYRLAELWNTKIERNPNNPDLMSEVGAILLRTGEDEQGLQWLQRALLASNDAHQPTLLLLFHYYESKGDEAKANDYRRALELLNGGRPLPAATAGKN